LDLDLFGLANSDMESNSQTASAKKRGRGPNAIKEKFNEKGKEVELDKFHRPVVTTDTTSFPTEFGILMRMNIPISFVLWKDVPEENKLKIWETLKVNNVVLSSQAFI
jgi:hypothetical protein